MLSYAEGFRVPTFTELYVPDMFFPSGNPNLEPEHSKTWEAQLRGAHYDTDWSFGVYRTDVEDLITDVMEFDPVFVREMRNVGKARINGLDLSASRDFMGWTTRLNLGLVDPRDRDTGHTLPGRSRRNLALDVDKQFGDYSFGFSWLGVSSRYVDAANTQKSPGYGRIDIRAGWGFLKGLKVETRVENIANKQYSQKYYGSGSSFSSNPFGDGVPYVDNDVDIPDPTIEENTGFQEEGRKVVMTLVVAAVLVRPPRPRSPAGCRPGAPPPGGSRRGRQQALGQRRLQQHPHAPPQVTGAVARVMAEAEQLAGALVQHQCPPLACQALVEARQFDVEQGLQVVLADALEDDAVQPVEELRVEVALQRRLQHPRLIARGD